MKLPRIIAFTGHARHGKDTCAAYLVQCYGYARFSLAEPLKAASLPIFGWDEEWAEAHKDEVDPRWGIKPREAWQALGTEFGQFALQKFEGFAVTTGRKLWIRSLLTRAEGEPLVVISDLRFPHEAEEVHAADGVVVRVHRPAVPVDRRHESEVAIDKVPHDFLAVNGSTIEALERELDYIMHELTGIALLRDLDAGQSGGAA